MREARKAKIACTIDAQVLARVEHMRARTGESRSAVIGRALDMLTDRATRAERVRRYADAYRELPESAEAVRVARTAARRALVSLAWDDE